MNADASRNGGPHAVIPTDDPRERFTLELFDRLWSTYRDRVEHVATYERMIHDADATFVNDHIAVRTFACQNPPTGMFSIARLFESLGYIPAGAYHFPDKHLDAVHLQHPHSQFPKVFVSELRTWELSGSARAIVESVIASHRPLPTAEFLATLSSGVFDDESSRESLLRTALSQFHELPWNLPEADDVERLNEESQYAAWVLVHGYNINHFTSLINSHRVEAVCDIEKTIDALKSAGVPMKNHIEGERGTKLRQSATTAVLVDVPVLKAGRETTMPWTYAYFELAERGNVTDVETGETARFEGFLGPQATHLFEMTRKR